MLKSSPLNHSGNPAKNWCAAAIQKVYLQYHHLFWNTWRTLHGTELHAVRVARCCICSISWAVAPTGSKQARWKLRTCNSRVGGGGKPWIGSPFAPSHGTGGMVHGD